jgi:glutamate-5-semialdehyde dehydrogenase
LIGPVDARLVKAAQPDDFGQEFLALILSIRVIDSMDDALDHIERYGSGHTETIVTENYSNTERFLNEVDSAVVMVNASTRFNDGAQLGLGAEVAISTDKLHARGPMGLRELTSYTWVVRGDGHVRE